MADSFPGWRPVIDPDTGEVLFYEPDPNYKAPRSEDIVGTSVSQEEIPIPYVSLPDVPKEEIPAVKPSTSYDVTKPEVVPEAPAEQLEKLLPPTDTKTELDNLLPAQDAFEAAAARVRRRAPIRPPEDQQEKPDRDFIEGATAPVRLGAAKFLEHPSNLFYGIPAALTGLLADIEEGAGTENVPLTARGGIRGNVEPGTGMRNASEYLKELAAGSKKGIAKATFTEGQKPVTPVEKVGSWLGEYAQPTKGVSAIATVGLAAAGAAARGGLVGLDASDIPIPSLVAEAKAAEDPMARFAAPAQQGFPTPPATPPVKAAPKAAAPKVPTPIPPGSKTITPPPMPNVPYAPTPQVAVTEAKPKKERAGTTPSVVPEGMVIPPPDLRTTAPPNMKRASRKGVFVETEEQFAKRFENAWVAKEIKARTYTGTATEMFESVNGPQKIGATEYKAIGILGGILVGIAMSGKILPKLRATQVPQPRPVAAAAPGTTAISTRMDLARASDDIIAPLTRIANRAGLNKDVLARLEQRFRIQTRSGARALADSAVDNGHFTTPSFTFRAPVALSDIARKSTPQTDEYLKILNTNDQLLVKKKVGEMLEGGENIVVNSQTIKENIKLMGDMEKAFPEVKMIAEANRKWNAAIRSFQKNGEYSTLTKEQADTLSASHKNSLGNKASQAPMKDQADYARRVIKERLDNEAVGIYVDEMRKVDPSYFVKITKEQLEANPSWKPNTVTFKRRGESEYYTTDPLLAGALTADHHVITSYGGNATYATKRLLESTTTGTFAPHFSIVNAIRSNWIAKFTTEQGFRAPTAVGAVLAIPQQIIPQVAKSISRGLESGSFGMLTQTFGKEWTDSLAKRLAVVFDESIYAQMKAAGSHRGHYIEQQQRSSALQAMSEAFGNAAAANPALKGAQHFANAWRATLESVHNASAHNFFRRNIGRENDTELALRARRLTGDPRASGQFYDKSGKRLRFEPYEAKAPGDQALANILVKGYGYTMEAASKSIPWWNATMQGAKRIGEAYLHDPIRFSRSTGLYAMAPAAAAFYYAKSLGDDPNGRSYLDYLLNGRSAYNRQMNFYIPIPGRPANEGVEITFFHELNPFKRAAEIFLHHMLGSNIPNEDPASMLFTMPDNITRRRPLREDLWTAAWAFLDTAIIPPMPPLVNVALGAFGIRGPQGVFAGDAYPVKSDPYNQNGGLPTSLEIMSRAGLGGVGEALAQFYAAATNSEGGIANAVKNGIAQVGETQIKKTPIVRDVAGIIPDISNNTDLAKEVFENQRHFNDLAKFYKKWTVNEGSVNVKPASTGGGIAVGEQYGLQQLNAANPGLKQPLPNNPIYIEYMKEYYNAFIHESPNAVKGEDRGGVAFKSLFRNYGTATQKIERLKDVNHGTYDRWQREMEPEARTELEENGVDTTDRQQVLNFYRRKQFDALRVISYVQRHTDEIMSRRASEAAGQPVSIKLKDLKPFLGPVEQGMQEIGSRLFPSPFMYPDLLPQ